MSEKKIGFIGQGWIGKNYADDFERRGFDVIRYSLEEPYVQNREKIKECDIVFIAVPTPTSVHGFDSSILRAALKSVGQGKIAVIKSTILPGTTESIQAENKDIFVLHSPEFLEESSAAYNAANPNRNIIGIPSESDEYHEKAREVLAVLPYAPYQTVCRAKEAELIKYAGNCFLYFKVIFANLFADLAEKHGCRWEAIRDAVAADPRIGRSHLDPMHKSGRGAGGHCFIKDFAAFREDYENNVSDKVGLEAIQGLEKKNIDLLLKSGKDIDLLKGVYGEDIAEKYLDSKES